MRANYLILIFLFSFINNLSSQNQTSSLTITPVVFDKSEELSSSVKDLLIGKMRQIATKYGFSSNEIKDRHIIFPEILVLTKDIVSGAPPKVMMNLEVTFYIADYDTRTIYTSETFTLKGVVLQMDV
jgi:hypothetical protein